MSDHTWRIAAAIAIFAFAIWIKASMWDECRAVFSVWYCIRHS